jgi:hypothetical protein
MKVMKAVIASIGTFLVPVAILFGITWAVLGNEFFLYGTFAPKMEAVRAKTFEESHAYNEGVAQDLSHDQQEYIQASPAQKAALRSLILHRYAVYDQDRLPPDLRQFLNSLKEGTQ